MTGLESIIEISEADASRVLEENGVLAVLREGTPKEKAPDVQDLARLYLLVRARKPFTILECGSGHSTVVMAMALRQNWTRYLQACRTEPAFAQPRMVTVETYPVWQENTRAKIDRAGLTDYVTFHLSAVHAGEHHGQVCHFYDDLPDVVPDFLYLDGPASSSIEGSVGGLSFRNPQRTVMSGDPLRYESTLLPGFFMIVDGRTNNARFLERSLTRKYRVRHSAAADVTTFELDEAPLGRKNVMGRDAYRDSEDPA